MNPFANSAQNKKQTKEIVASAFTADEILSIHPIAPNKWGRYVYLRPFLQNKRRKGSLSSRTFLLSLDLRDYPIEKWGFSPSVPRSDQKLESEVFPGFR